MIFKRFNDFLEKVTGNKNDFSLECRLFHFVVIFGIFIAVIANINHIILKNHIMSVIVPSVFSLASLGIYYLSRFRNKYALSLWIYLSLLLFVMAPLLWFFNGGSIGGFQHYMFLFFIGICSLLKGKARLVTLAIFILLYASLITLEFYHPELISGFKLRFNIFFDIAFSMAWSIITVVILFMVYRNAYEQEKNKASEYSIELEKEKNVLNVKFERMNMELDMARSIQRQFIEVKRNIPYIDFIYYPMAKLGGDFLHFFRFRYSDEIGIFISDVSGHGVPGALITGMIYSHLLEIAPRIKDPAQILSSLNNVLIGNTGNNFITAIYGIYYPVKREFVYSNAGHNSPYVIDGKSCHLLDESGRSLPLAVMSNSELEDIGKSYSISSVKFNKDSKVLLYTDGLTEAVNINKKDAPGDSQNYETIYFPDFLLQISKTTPQEFLYSLMENLKIFRGGVEFDDDICAVCMDIR